MEDKQEIEDREMKKMWKIVLNKEIIIGKKQTGKRSREFK